MIDNLWYYIASHAVNIHTDLLKNERSVVCPESVCFKFKQRAGLFTLYILFAVLVNFSTELLLWKKSLYCEKKFSVSEMFFINVFFYNIDGTGVQILYLYISLLQLSSMYNICWYQISWVKHGRVINVDTFWWVIINLLHIFQISSALHNISYHPRIFVLNT